MRKASHMSCASGASTLKPEIKFSRTGAFPANIQLKLQKKRLFQEHDVGKMFPLPRGSLPSCDEQNIIYLVRPKVETMDIIAENVHR